MKKTYISPRAEATNIELEQMVCASVNGLNSTLIDETVSGDQALSNSIDDINLWDE